MGLAAAPAKFVSVAPQSPQAEVAGASATPYAASAGPSTSVQPGVGAAPESQSPASAALSFAPARVAGTPSGVVADPGDEKVVTPPTRTPVSPDPYHYVASGKEVGLTTSATRVAVGFDSAPAKGAAFAGLTYVRPVNPTVAVYEGPGAGSAASLARLAATPGARFAVPVFTVVRGGGEAVLLDEVIVALRPGVTEAQYFTGNAAFSSHRHLTGTPDQFVATAAAGRGVAALSAANAANADPRVRFAEPNFYQTVEKDYIPNDPRFGNEWHLKNTGQGKGTPGADSNLPAAWDINKGGSAGVTVAVIDDGVPTDHPDLLNWVNPGEIPGDGIDNDGNGFVDDVNGWNFVQNTPDATPIDPGDAHGTAVSGVAAARGDNGVGVAGAAYNSAVMSIKIFQGDAIASEADIAGALYYAAGRTADGKGTWKSADVANGSWHLNAPSSALTDALAYGTVSGRQGLGTPYFFASGNKGLGSLNFPAVLSVENSGVIAVGASTNLDTRCDYSQYGAGLDFVTPSGTGGGTLNIDTTDRVGAFGYDPSDYTGTGANGFNGTSSATPLAAGIGALVLAQAQVKGVTLSPSQLKGMLRNDTDLIGGARYDTTTGLATEFGGGRLNAFAAVDGVGKPEISITSTTQDLVSTVSAVDFGSVTAGTQKDITLRIRNQGTSPLVISGISAAGGAFAATGPTAKSIGVGDAATFVGSFVPSAAGAFAGTITVTSNDADEGTFVIKTTGAGTVARLFGTAFEDWNGNKLRDANDPAVAGQLVYADVNKNGKLDTAVTKYSGAGFTFGSPTAGGTGAATVPASQGSPALDVNVTVSATTPIDYGMRLSLIGPDGTRVRLVEGTTPSYYGVNFAGTTFDDQASAGIDSGSAPFTGTFRPLEPLAAFNGKPAAGKWTLEATDTYGFGLPCAVNSWSLAVTSASEPSAPTSSAGTFGFAALPAGTYPIRTATPAGWTATSASAQTITVPAGAGALAPVAFGEAKNNRFYGNVFGDADGNGARNGAEAALAGRTVFVDANGNGKLDPAQTTAPVNTTTAALPYGRPLGAFVTTSALNVSALGAVTDVNVNLDISHTWDEDLDVTLIAPDGTRVLLFSHVGKNEDNFTNTTLDDQAARVIGSGRTAAPFTGSFKPMGSLADFNGKAASGAWTLEVVDTFPGLDGGSLNRWSVTVASQEQSAVSDARGNVYFDLPAGPNTVRIIPPASGTVTTPAGGAYTVTASGAPIFERLFGVK